jgi:hypothetical protein
MTDQITIKAAPAELRSHSAIYAYVEELISKQEKLSKIRYALTEIVNHTQDDTIEIHVFAADEDGERPHAVHVVWMPEIGRAACNVYGSGSGDWRWTNASSPEDAARRYSSDDMAN